VPELPDVEAYCAALNARHAGEAMAACEVLRPFFLRSVAPPPSVFVGRRLRHAERLGKRVGLLFEGGGGLVVHLMVAGRLLALPPGRRPPTKPSLAALEFPSGSIVVTEAGTRRRASMHACATDEEARSHDPGGLQPIECSPEELLAALQSRNRTLKRALTEPGTLSGVGNAYSDEILFAARLPPLRLTGTLTLEEAVLLAKAATSVLGSWRERLTAEFCARFPGPGEVTAFRPGFTVHGRYGQPCPNCAWPVQRIRYSDSETNYCAQCQNGGRIYADRGLSRLLKDDWPRAFED
jgi:formamidopyrimidine-DNA glycosylase